MTVPVMAGRPRRLWQVPTFLLGLLVLGVVGTNAVFRTPAAVSDRDSELAQLRQALLRKGADVAGLLPRAEEVLSRPHLPPRRAAEVHHLLGAALLKRAGELSGERGRTERQKAIQHLERADAIGVAASDRPRLWFLLGKALYQNQADPQRIIQYLTRAAAAGLEHAGEANDLLVQVYLNLPTPDIDAALEVNQKVLASSRSEEVLTPARLLRGQLLVRKGNYADALKVLERIPATAPREVRLQANLLLVRCCEEEQLWNRAIPLWTALLETPAVVPGGKAHIWYHLGICQRHAEPPRLADAIKSWEQAWQEGGEEGQAARLRLAELRLHESPGQLEQAVRDLSQALEKVQKPEDFQNSIVEVGRVRQMVSDGLRLARESLAFDHGQALAELSRKLHPAAVAEEHLAENAAAWARHLEDQGRRAKGQEAEQLKKQAREQWSRAGRAAGQAAQFAPSDQQADCLWRSVEYYRRAEDHNAVITVLQRFVQLPLPAPRLAEGWFALAEARWALGRKEEARQAYYKCLEYPSTSFAYRARYQLAEERIAAQQFDEAELILEQNVNSANGLDLDRAAHEKSLYRLALLLFNRQNYTKAAVLLKEATRQYPDNAEALWVRDHLGEAYRKLAEQADLKLKDSKDPPTTMARSQYLQDLQDWLTQAADVYQKLADELEQRQATQKLSEREEALLRRAQFMVADLQFDLSNFPEALRRYRKLAELYHARLEGLIATQRIWKCGGVMVEPEQNRAVLEAVQVAVKSAQENLPRIPDSQFQNGPSRQEWERWLREVHQFLGQMPTTSLRPQP